MPASRVTIVKPGLHSARRESRKAKNRKIMYSQPCATPSVWVIHSPRSCAPLPGVVSCGVEGKMPHIEEPSKFASGTPTRISTMRRTPTTVAMTR